MLPGRHKKRSPLDRKIEERSRKNCGELQIIWTRSAWDRERELLIRNVVEVGVVGYCSSGTKEANYEGTLIVVDRKYACMKAVKLLIDRLVKDSHEKLAKTTN